MLRILHYPAYASADAEEVSGVGLDGVLWWLMGTFPQTNAGVAASQHLSNTLPRFLRLAGAAARGAARGHQPRHRAARGVDRRPPALRRRQDVAGTEWHRSGTEVAPEWVTGWVWGAWVRV